MFKNTVFIFLFILNGVFGVDGDEGKSVSVMEGDSVTLHTDIPQIQKDDLILWMFGPKETTIAQILKQANSSVIHDNVDDGRFRAKLQLNSQTGSLTITNIRSAHNGLYKLTIINSRGTSYKKFNVSVYAPLPVPVITRVSNSSNCSSSSERSSISKCVLLCSVLNVTDVRNVSLSWYKGNSLLSSISVSDLNIRLSLPLEVEYQDTNTYSCVVSNPIKNQTQLLNITFCQLCSEQKQRIHLIALIAVPLLLLLLISGACGLMYWKWKKCKQGKYYCKCLESFIACCNVLPLFQDYKICFIVKETVIIVKTVETIEEEIHYATTTFCTRRAHSMVRIVCVQCSSSGKTMFVCLLVFVYSV